MPKFDVHIYPIFRTKVRLEAESPDHAERMATGMIFDNFARLGHGFSVGRHEFEFADDTDIALVDLLDDAGGVQESVPVGDKSCLNSSELATVLAALPPLAANRGWQARGRGLPAL